MASYKYIDNPEKEPQIRNAWCYECETITKVAFPYLNTHTTEIQDDATYDIKLLKNSIFYRFSTQKKKEVCELQKIINEEEEIMQVRVNYFKNSSFKSHCISCGSYKIEKLKPFTTYMKHYFSVSMTDEQPESTGITHTCGGEIEASIQARYNFGSNYTPIVIEYNEDKIITSR